tara:strand:+ start:629 stop:1237 length:609 start_codon:yes stop_codon:yes gene_type:complete
VKSFGAVIYSIGIFGLIARRDDPTGHGAQWFAQHVANVTDWLVEHAAPSARLIFQAALPGAPACGCAHEPGLLPPSLTSCAASPFINAWCGQWTALSELNREAARALDASRGGAGRVKLVDPWRMLEVRTDAHRGSSCVRVKFGATCESAGGSAAHRCRGDDCLHWHVPGALDVMARVHQHILDEWPEELAAVPQRAPRRAP